MCVCGWAVLTNTLRNSHTLVSREKELLFRLWERDRKVEQVSTLGQQMKSCSSSSVSGRWTGETKVRPVWRMRVLWWGWNPKSSLFVLEHSWHFPLSITCVGVCRAERTNLSAKRKQRPSESRAPAGSLFPLTHLRAVHSPLDTHALAQPTHVFYGPRAADGKQGEENEQVLM